MEQFLKLFTNHSAYSQAENSLDKPNVSRCMQEDEIHYNPYVRPNLCYRQIGDYYVLCGNDGKIHRVNDHGDVFYLGWNNSTTKIFHNMAPSGNYEVISSVVSADGAVIPQEVYFSVTTTNGVSYLTNNKFTWKGTNYVFSNGTWTPSIPGGEYIAPNSGGGK